MHPMIRDKIYVDRVDCNQARRTWSCCSHASYAGFSIPASQSASVRNRKGICGFPTNLRSLCNLMTSSICCCQRRKFESSSFYEIEYGKVKVEEEEIEFVAIDDRLSSGYHHRVFSLRELWEREREIEEVKYHLLTQWTSGLKIVYIDNSVRESNRIC